MNTARFIAGLLPLAFAVHSALVNAAPSDNKKLWPEQLNLAPLRSHDVESNPYGNTFDYAKEFSTLDLQAVKTDLKKTLTTSQPWWPADYGNYGPFFIRMAWHAAGTYRLYDGRGGAAGGQQRFSPLNSWPDNVNLDKARRLLWPVKQKYGAKISWGDLMVLAGNVAMESMGFKTLGFAGGRQDDWQSDLVYWGAGSEPLSNNRDKNGKLEKPLGATQMGLIYVNPEGPGGKPDPLAAAKDIREAFGRMAMNDEETVALIAGGHTFGKAHGAAAPDKCVDPAPDNTDVAQQGLGWANKCGSGKGKDTISSGLEGAWTTDPTHFTMLYLKNLYAYDWVLTKSPAGASQWQPKDAENLVPDAADPKIRHPLMMFTTDIALKTDPEYKKISLRFKDHPEEFKKAFAQAWFKLTHRDMGPKSRYLGSEIPKEDFLWQDPLPAANYAMIDNNDITALKKSILDASLSERSLIKTAWASASTFRMTDYRGGNNGARIRLAPQSEWKVNDPQELTRTLTTLEKIQSDFNNHHKGGKQVSLADLIVLAGNTAVEDAAKKAGFTLHLPFTAGRTDASQEQTDIRSFSALEPTADGFRNYYDSSHSTHSPLELLVDKADKLGLTVPEMTVLIGGLRVLDANAGDSKAGVLTNTSGSLNNAFFVNLLDMNTEWKKSAKDEGLYEGFDRQSGKLQWTASPVDLVFGSNSELRAVSEVYAADDGQEKFVQDFAKAWSKVMNLDRFDLHK
jgi:catalase/peroxidase HPI